jgi:hypothetical protein
VEPEAKLRRRDFASGLPQAYPAPLEKARESKEWSLTLKRFVRQDDVEDERFTERGFPSPPTPDYVRGCRLGSADGLSGEAGVRRPPSSSGETELDSRFVEVSNAQLVSRLHARELRRAATFGGAAMLVAGAIASVDALMKGSIGAVSPSLLLGGGAVVAFRASRARRSIWAGGLKADLFLLGVALAVGGLVELLHALGVLAGNPPHLGLAGALAVGAAWLLTGENRPAGVEARVIGALRISGVVLTLSATSRFVGVGIGEPHGHSSGLSMLLLSVAGLALFRAGVRTPALGWQRL